MRRHSSPWRSGAPRQWLAFGLGFLVGWLVCNLVNGMQPVVTIERGGRSVGVRPPPTWTRS
jgi:hypothetical protein